MKCQKCGVNNANTHVKSIINGEIKEYDLCSECAKKMGYTNVFSDIEDEFSNFLGSFFGNALPARTQARRCETCGSTYSEIAKKMDCSTSGVRWNFQEMIAKAGYSCKEDLIAAALESKLIVTTLK